MYINIFIYTHTHTYICKYIYIYTYICIDKISREYCIGIAVNTLNISE